MDTLFPDHPFSSAVDETQFVDVILPVPIPRMFTYKVPKALQPLLQIGCRVLVQFGKKKVLTGIIGRVHQSPPQAYEAKPVLDLLEEQPSANPLQIDLDPLPSPTASGKETSSFLVTQQLHRLASVVVVGRKQGQGSKMCANGHKSKERNNGLRYALHCSEPEVLRRYNEHLRQGHCLRNPTKSFNQPTGCVLVTEELVFPGPAPDIRQALMPLSRHPALEQLSHVYQQYASGPSHHHSNSPHLNNNRDIWSKTTLRMGFTPQVGLQK